LCLFDLARHAFSAFARRCAREGFLAFTQPVTAILVDS